MKLFVFILLITSCVSVKRKETVAETSKNQKIEKKHLDFEEYQSFPSAVPLYFFEDQSLTLDQRNKSFRCEEKRLNLFLIGISLNDKAKQKRKGICI
ncbi:MAG: hypothetical protein CL674_08535 [Bdellovibrionaceae bacterium]|nr:hypothetical protein [Pseudobdellovibrionaceae bacterium]|tara:strand:+ start:36586 stop:36876 length:291 start_codon:yes stop_codon:yes gene_type:complete